MNNNEKQKLKNDKKKTTKKTDVRNLDMNKCVFFM